MDVQLQVDPKDQYFLTTQEMRCIVGGTLTQGLIRLVVYGVSYFYNMGIKEGRRMRDLL